MVRLSSGEEKAGKMLDMSEFSFIPGAPTYRI